MSEEHREWQCAGEMDPYAPYCTAEDFQDPLWVNCYAKEHENCGWWRFNPHAEARNADPKDKMRVLSSQIYDLEQQAWELQRQRDKIEVSLVPDWTFVGK